MKNMTQEKHPENFKQIKINIEAILFSYGDWLSVKEISNVLDLENEKVTLNALAEVRKKFAKGFTFQIEESDVAGWRMVLKSEHEDLVTSLISDVEIPQATLKVLSIIAYEQPVTKTRLGEIIGRTVKTDVEYLYKHKFLSYEKVGIGKYYRVTKKFYDYFKLDANIEFRKQAEDSINTFLEEPVSKAKLAEEIEKEEKTGKISSQN